MVDLKKHQPEPFAHFVSGLTLTIVKLAPPNVSPAHFWIESDIKNHMVHPTPKDVIFPSLSWVTLIQ